MEIQDLTFIFSYEWGSVFAMNPEQVTLTDEKYEEMIRKYQEELNL